jgi:hypothetical protein
MWVASGLLARFVVAVPITTIAAALTSSSPPRVPAGNGAMATRDREGVCSRKAVSATPEARTAAINAPVLNRFSRRVLRDGMRRSVVNVWTIEKDHL